MRTCQGWTSYLGASEPDNEAVQKLDRGSRSLNDKERRKKFGMNEFFKASPSFANKTQQNLLGVTLSSMGRSTERIHWLVKKVRNPRKANRKTGELRSHSETATSWQSRHIPWKDEKETILLVCWPRGEGINFPRHGIFMIFFRKMQKKTFFITFCTISI